MLHGVISEVCLGELLGYMACREHAFSVIWGCEYIYIYCEDGNMAVDVVFYAYIHVAYTS